ncbi:MAG TPA: glycosyltransferase family 4 protein [Candidatus Sulfotelmatobacter sp.]|nr:glycosyltransferase family 4 protein [Candidatus Sulfotelmatobacter sp.]
MKVGIVSQSYYPRYGGVTEHVHHTAVELRRRGHDVTIITSRFREGEAGLPDVERIGMNVLVPFNRAFVDLTVGWNLRRDLERVLRAHDFDLLHVHCPTAPTLPILAIESATCPLVGTFHTTSGRSALMDFFKPRLTRCVEKLTARVAVSRTARQSAELYFPGTYELIPNGVDVERFHGAIEPFGEWRDPDRVNLLFVGRLDPRKGLDLLIAAMPRILERTGGRARLLVVGDSYLRPKFEASVAPSARAHVHFLGHVPSADLPRWYATGDIFVSPASGNESFGIVLLEAMAAARPVVASDIPGYRSVVVPDVNGVLFPPGDVEALARTVSRLAEDPERRLLMAGRGRARALEFAWPRVTDRLESVYREALTRRAAVHTAA